MAALQYAEKVKEIPFTSYEGGSYRQGAVLGGDFHGLDIHVQYGVYRQPGRMGGATMLKPHVHDFDQILLWAGSGTDDISDLHAEVALCLGEELETHIFSNATAVAIPRGLPHMPATVNRADRPVVFMAISCAPEYKATELKTDALSSAPAGWRGAKYRQQLKQLAFTRKGAWYYGPENQDDGGGSLSFIHMEDRGIAFSMIYGVMKKAPYRIGPYPDKPHAHKNPQLMLLLGTDPDDLGDLGGEFEICMGKEQERHVFTRSTAVITPPFLPHWPGGMLKCHRPMLFVDIHPGGDTPVTV